MKIRTLIMAPFSEKFQKIRRMLSRLEADCIFPVTADWVSGLSFFLARRSNPAAAKTCLQFRASMSRVGIRR
jgi:hypothetical protein